MNQLVAPPHVGLKNLKHRLFAPFRRVVLAALLLCTVWAARGQNLTVKFNGYAECTGQASLEAAMAAIMYTGLELGNIESIEITAGDVVAGDWLYLSNNTSNLSQLKHFTVTNAVNSVAPIYNRIFGNSIETVSVAKTEEIGSAAFSNCINLSSVSFPHAKSIYALEGLQGFVWRHPAFEGCTKLAEMHLGATPPEINVGNLYNTVTSLPSKRTILRLVDDNGNPLTGNALSDAIAAYKDVDDGNRDDNLWYGVYITEPSLSIGLVINGSTEEVTANSIQAALSGKALGNIESITINEGVLTSADWNYLSEQRNNLSKLSSFACRSTLRQTTIMSNNADPIFGTSLTHLELYSPCEVGGFAFYGCTNLSHADLSGVESLGQSSFNACEGLTKVVLPRVTSCESNAFYACSNLEIVELHVVESMDDGVFVYCSKIKTISLPSVPPALNGTLFGTTPPDDNPTLNFLDSYGSSLNDDKLLAAIEAYKADAGYDGTTWHGCLLPVTYNVSLRAVGEGGFSSSCPIAFMACTSTADYVVLSGKTLQIEAYSRHSSHFVRWISGSTELSTSSSLTITVDRDTLIYAEFELNEYSLSYSADEGGTIQGQLTQTVQHGGSGEEVEAEPSDGYRFVKWSDEVTTAKRTDANVTADISVTAIFELIPTYTLTYTAGDNGSISGTTPQTVREGESGSEVEAVPNDGYRFVKWSDEVTTAKRTDSNVQGDISVTAIFELIPTYTLTYTAGEGGSISGITPQTVREGQSGSEVEAVPAEGYKFLRWSDGLTTTKRTDTNVRADLSVTAEFIDANINIYTLTYTASKGGSIKGTATQNVITGQSGTEVEAVPSEGYRFVKWSDGNTNAKRTDSNVNADISVEAQFAIISYTLSYTASEGGSISGQATQTVQHGGSGTEVEAVAQEGYRFVKWSDGRTTAKRTDTNVQGNLTVTAEFEKSNATGLLDTQLDALSVYPNPTTGQLWVSVPELAEGTAAEVHVYNANGQLLQRVPARAASAGSASSRLSIDLSAYPAGMYIIRVGNAVAKVVKQ